MANFGHVSVRQMIENSSHVLLEFTDCIDTKKVRTNQHQASEKRRFPSCNEFTKMSCLFLKLHRKWFSSFQNIHSNRLKICGQLCETPLIHAPGSTNHYYRGCIYSGKLLFPQKVGHLPKVANFWPLLVQWVFRRREVQLPSSATVIKNFVRSAKFLENHLVFFALSYSERWLFLYLRFETAIRQPRCSCLLSVTFR